MNLKAIISCCLFLLVFINVSKSAKDIVEFSNYKSKDFPSKFEIEKEIMDRYAELFEESGSGVSDETTTTAQDTAKTTTVAIDDSTTMAITTTTTVVDETTFGNIDETTSFESSATTEEINVTTQTTESETTATTEIDETTFEMIDNTTIIKESTTNQLESTLSSVVDETSTPVSSSGSSTQIVTQTSAFTSSQANTQATSAIVGTSQVVTSVTERTADTSQVTTPTTTTTGTSQGATSTTASTAGTSQAVTVTTSAETTSAQVITLSTTSSGFCPTTCGGCLSCVACKCTCIPGYVQVAGDEICRAVTCKEMKIPFVNSNDELVTFPETQPGYSNKTVETCNNEPDGTPYGTSFCSVEGKWTNTKWVSSCETQLTNLTDINITTPAERQEVATDVEVLTSDAETLTSDDISNAVEALDSVVTSITDEPLEKETADSVVESIGNILQASEDQLAESNQVDKIMETLDSLSKTVDLNSGENYNHVTSTIALSVLQPNDDQVVAGDVGYSFQSYSLPVDQGFREDQLSTFYSENTNLDSTSFIKLSLKDISGFSSANGDRISFQAFANDKLFGPTSSLQPTNEPQSVNSEVVFTADVVDKSNVVESKNFVTMMFSLNPDNMAPDNSYETQCVFWDEGANLWSLDGGVTTRETNTNVTCSFNHLTNFATIWRKSSFAIELMDLIGPSVSTLFLVLVVIVFALVSSSRKKEQFRSAFLLLNFTISLLFLNIPLILDVQYFVAQSVTACAIIAIFVHFAVLSSAAWMTVEAVNLYLAIIHAYYTRSNMSNLAAILMVSAWGWWLPIIAVLLLGALVPDFYSYAGITCYDNWINPEYILYAITIPVGCMFGFCFFTYNFVFIQMCCGSFTQQMGHRKWHAWRNVVLSYLLFIVVAGTWLFGFVFPSEIPSLDEVSAYCFPVFNILQGLVLLILYLDRQQVFSSCCSKSVSGLNSRQNSLRGPQNVQTEAQQLRQRAEHGSQVAMTRELENVFAQTTPHNRRRVAAPLATISEHVPTSSGVLQYRNAAYDHELEMERQQGLHMRRHTGGETSQEARDSVFSENSSPGELYDDLVRNMKYNRSFEFKIRRPAVVATTHQRSWSMSTA